jgi:hypothetical protein
MADANALATAIRAISNKAKKVKPLKGSEREARILLYQQRVANKQDIWTGKPLPNSDDESFDEMSYADKMEILNPEHLADL